MLNTLSKFSMTNCVTVYIGTTATGIVVLDLIRAQLEVVVLTVFMAFLELVNKLVFAVIP